MTEIRGRILQTLREAGDRFVSGEELGQKLGISRTAVWKHIQSLQGAGYPIEAVRNRGYRLLWRGEVLSAEAIQAGLTTRSLGKRMAVLETVDSTNRYAFAEAERGAPEGYTVLAERQTAGKGRRGRAWFSPPGTGIWMSVVLRPGFPVYKAPQLTLTAAVSVADAVRKVTGVPVGIKWPNDLLLPDGRKVCGILSELSAEAEEIRFVVLGIGLNVFGRPETFPPELRTVAGALAPEGEQISRIALIQSMLAHLERDYAVYSEDGFSPLKNRWERLNVSLGRRIAVQTSRGRLTGWARRIDDDGALWVEADTGEMEPIISADVIFDPH
ncbi:MAG: biotin--[acetyl-CoA-carboxylase] ligase [Kyrpidia sp.]|nr:biotin--[acetyl-CoA-carboxylase] ligase [Kyrpidia sp.]